MLIFVSLALAILTGQIIKIPVFSTSGLTLLDLTLIVLVLIGLIQLKFRLKKPGIALLSALLFALTATLSLAFTPLKLNLQEYLISFSYTARFFLYVFFVWLIQNGAFPKLKENIHNILLFSGVGLAILGLLQLIFLPNLSFLENSGWDPHYFRVVSTFLDPNFAGAYFTLTLLLLFSKFKHFGQIKWVIFILITYLSLLATFSRSSYIMFLLAGLLYSCLKRSKILITTTLVLSLGLFFGFFVYTQAVAKPRNIDRGESASFRLTTWQQGIDIFSRSPILGTGFNTYRFSLEEYNLSNEQFLSSRGSTSNDSSLLYVLSTTGIVGLISYLFFLLNLMKVKNLILISAISGILVHSLFANSLFYPPILLWLLLFSEAPKK